MRVNLKLGRWLLHYDGKLVLYKTIPGLLGMQSITEDRQHVLFLDFDRTVQKKVYNTCKTLQDKWNLGNFYIFRSSGASRGRSSYHAICLDKMSFGAVADIQLSLGMKKYLLFAVLRGFWILRVSPKKEHVRCVGCIARSSTIRMSSNAHFDFLNKLYENRLVSPKTLDKSTKIKVDIYSSVNK